MNATQIKMQYKYQQPKLEFYLNRIKEFKKFYLRLLKFRAQQKELLTMDLDGIDPSDCCIVICYLLSLYFCLKYNAFILHIRVFQLLVYMLYLLTRYIYEKML